MKQALLRLLVCPQCKADLRSEPWQADDEIWEGLLDCSCGEVFPIIQGVPRMLMGHLREQLWQSYPSFFARHGARLPAGWLPATRPSEEQRDAVRTQRSFGFEWQRFSMMRPEWEQNFWSYMAPKQPEFLRGKRILDAGCGMGRHLYHASCHGSEVIGIDFSCAVDAARRNTADLPNAHVVQADLMSLPFRKETFDFIYSLGVLHHLPDPAGVFHCLLDYLRPGGETRIYVYWDLAKASWWKRTLLAAVTTLRRLTIRLPHRLLLWLCYPIAACAWLTFVLPSRLFARLPLTRSWADALILNQYAEYPFGVLVNDQFDRFAAPIEQRFGPDQVRAWLEGANLHEVEVTPFCGWVGNGRKALGEIT
jgi:SAM-dependent methyltransferase/uncharacterized protein YbaR (Trm112 family)